MKPFLFLRPNAISRGFAARKVNGPTVSHMSDWIQFYSLRGRRLTVSWLFKERFFKDTNDSPRNNNINRKWAVRTRLFSFLCFLKSSVMLLINEAIHRWRKRESVLCRPCLSAVALVRTFFELFRLSMHADLIIQRPQNFHSTSISIFIDIYKRLIWEHFLHRKFSFIYHFETYL